MAPSTDPWSIVDLYDDRSWIENGLFRNSKQFFTLTRWFPKRSAGWRAQPFDLRHADDGHRHRLSPVGQGASNRKQLPLPSPARQDRHASHRQPPTGEILPDAPHSLAHLAGHLAAPPLAARRHKPPALGPVTDPYATLPFLITLLDGQGLQRWRRQLQQDNRDKLIVFIADRYAIFDTHEFLVLTGVPLCHIPPHLGSREDILRRYACLPQPP